VNCRDGSRRPAVEILRGGPVPTKYILEGRALELGDYIKNAGNGQQNFDQDLLALHRQELISTSEALQNATNREALTMALRGIKSSKAVSEAGGGHQPRPAPQPQHDRRRTRPARQQRPQLRSHATARADRRRSLKQHGASPMFFFETTIPQRRAPLSIQPAWSVAPSSHPFSSCSP
jgi:hypothetical protein